MSSRPSRRRAATLLVGFVALLSPLLAVATPAQAVPSGPGIVVGPTAIPKDKVYRGYLACSGGPSSWCWGAVFVQVSRCTTGDYGCFYMSGKYWRPRDPSPGPYDNSAQANCVLGLVTAGVLGFLTGPWWATVVGGSVALYGCQGVS